MSDKNLFDRALGADEPELGLDFAEIERAGARAVRRRRVALPVLAGVTAVMLAGGAFVMTSRGGPERDIGPAASSAASATTGNLGAPVVGVGYPFELNTHCGIRSATFGGRWWAAIAPTEQPHPGGRDITVGTMTLVRPDLARFTWPDGTAEFVPVDSEPMPPCQ
ncbi:hypothetical protein [Actinokineospora sp.]|uniref:hypothetical protein n=1 Tax=Actinokineospora sp. TaxID=1872133 RepID=UPI003D6A8931